MEYNNDPQLVLQNQRLNAENEGLLRSLSIMRQTNDFLKEIILTLVSNGKDSGK